MYRQHLFEAIQTSNQQVVSYCMESEHRLKFRCKHYLCVACRGLIMLPDIITLRCGHTVCMDCCTISYESVRKWIRYHKSLPNAPLDGLVLCALCHEPSIVAKRVMQSTYGVLYTHFLQLSVSEQLCFHVEIVYENERRTLLGYFSKDALLPTDHRGAWSTSDGQCGRPPGKIQAPNETWHWMCNWSIIKHGSTEGWQYAINWPGTGVVSKAFEWQPKSAPLCLVRRRGWYRLRLRLTQMDITQIEDFRLMIHFGSLVASKMQTASPVVNAEHLGPLVPALFSGRREGAAMPPNLSFGSSANSAESSSSLASLEIADKKPTITQKLHNLWELERSPSYASSEDSARSESDLGSPASPTSHVAPLSPEVPVTNTGSFHDVFHGGGGPPALAATHVNLLSPFPVFL